MEVIQESLLFHCQISLFSKQSDTSSPPMHCNSFKTKIWNIQESLFQTNNNFLASGLSLFWIQIWYHFYLQSIWLIYKHIHIPKTMSASNLTKFATELLFFIPRNICCFAISTPSDSIGSKSYYFYTTL